MAAAKSITVKFARTAGLLLSALVGLLYLSLIGTGSLYGTKGAAAAIIASAALSVFFEALRKRFVKHSTISDFLLMMNWYGYALNSFFKLSIIFAALNMQYFKKKILGGGLK